MKELVQKVLGKFGYAIRRTSTLHGHDPASTTRPIAEVNLVAARKAIESIKSGSLV